MEVILSLIMLVLLINNIYTYKQCIYWCIRVEHFEKLIDTTIEDLKKI